MTIQSDLQCIASLGTTNIRVSVTVSPFVSWSTTEMRDTFKHFTIHLMITKVGVGPVLSESFKGKNLEVICSKALAKAQETVNAQNTVKRKKLKLKR